MVCNASYNVSEHCTSTTTEKVPSFESIRKTHPLVKNHTLHIAAWLVLRNLWQKDAFQKKLWSISQTLLTNWPVSSSYVRVGNGKLTALDALKIMFWIIYQICLIMMWLIEQLMCTDLQYLHTMIHFMASQLTNLHYSVVI